MLKHLVLNARLNLLHEIADHKLVVAFLAIEIETTICNFQISNDIKIER